MTTNQDRLFELLREVLYQEPTLESRFVEDLGADSIDTVEIFVQVENEFDIEITDEEAEKIETVQQLLDLIEEKAQ